MKPHEIAIVGDMRRSEQAWTLADMVSSTFMAMDDHHRLGPGRNHLRAWDWHQDNNRTPWAIVLEDDALPVVDFVHQAQEALQCAPSPVVSFYLGRSRPPHWQPSIGRVIADPETLGPRRESWLTAPVLLHHVGVAVKTSLLPLMCDSLPWHLQSGAPIDEAISLWCRRMNIRVAYTNPSLVDHDHTIPSVITAHTSLWHDDPVARDDPRDIRIAWTVGPRQRWNDRSVEIPVPVNEPFV